VKLAWTEPALSDLENIREYISRDSQHYAVQFIARVVEAVESLPAFPRIGRAVPEADDETIRELLFQSYRIMYRVETDRVLILTVLHGSRNLANVHPKPWDII
jgi:addiction module RelE/StbE family toxin